MTACATDRLVPIPDIVEVPGPIQWRDIPEKLTKRCEKSAIPDDLTYAQAIESWSEDRATIDICNGQLAGIESLNEQGTD